MNRKLMIILLAIFMVMAVKPVFAYDAAITATINIDYTNVNKHEMRLRGSFYAISDWQVDLAVRGDSGATYYISYKNGYGEATINGEYITEYLGGTYYSSSAQEWSEVTAPKTINNSLMLLTTDSFSDATAELIGIRISGNAVAIDAIGVVDDATNGYIEDFNTNSLTQGDWQIENSTTGVAQIDNTYASQGLYSVRIMSRNLQQSTSSSSTTQSNYYRDPTTGQVYYRDPTTGQSYYVNPSTGQPTTAVTTYAQQQYNPYAQQQYNPYAQQYNPYAQQQYNPYAQQYNPYAQQYNPYAQQQYNPYGQGQQVSYGQGGAVYAYTPIYQQGSTVQSPYSYSGQSWYSGQLGQQGTSYGTQTAYGYQNQGAPLASPYAGAYATPAGYAGGTGLYGGAYGSALYGYGNQYVAPLGGIGMPGVLGAAGIAPIGLDPLATFGGLGAGFGLGFPGSSLGLGLPGFSTFDPLGIAFFGGLF
ncbi:MAG: hypothetical protein ACMUIP_08620 [bacterium]